MTKTYSSFSTKVTPQAEPIPGEQQIKNLAGGYVYDVGKWQQLRRMCVLGVEGGTYYATERELLADNAKNTIACIVEDGTRVVQTVTDISVRGLAYRNDAAVFILALAISMGNTATRQAAAAAVLLVCRTGTDILHFAAYCDNLRGWGSALHKAIGGWFGGKSVEQLAYQVAKYQSRDKWAMRDLLRKVRPKADGSRNDLYHWIVKGELEQREGMLDLEIIAALELAKIAQTEETVAGLIREHNLSREMIPTKWLNSVWVWDALLQKMPMRAMIRNLGKMAAIGLLVPMSDAERHIVNALSNQDAIARSRLHPMALLLAQKVYEQGHGDKGSLRWSACARVIDALDGAFYMAFGNVQPTGKRIMLGIDASGSMQHQIMGLPITCREAAIAQALVIANAEPQYEIVGYTNGEHIKSVPISPKQRLGDAIATFNRMVVPQGTDCALPILYATKNSIVVDAFVNITDNETWAGKIHPSQALDHYRRRNGADVRLAVVGMTATNTSIARPDDPLSLEVVGYSADTPGVIRDFIAGEF